MDRSRDWLDESPVPHHEAGADGVVRRVNRAECALLGARAEEILGKPIWSFVAGEAVSESRAAFARKVRGEALTPFRRPYVTRDGRRLTVEVHEQRIENGSGQVSGIRSALIDVTEQAAAETALRENQRWLSTILRSISEAVIAVDSLGGVRFMNPAAERLTKWSSAEAAGHELESVVAFEDVGFAPSENGQGLKFAHEVLTHSFAAFATLVARDGCRTPVRFNSDPISSETGEVLGVVLVLDLIVR